MKASFDYLFHESYQNKLSVQTPTNMWLVKNHHLAFLEGKKGGFQTQFETVWQKGNILENGEKY